MSLFGKKTNAEMEELKGYTHKDQPARWDPNLPGDHS